MHPWTLLRGAVPNMGRGTSGNDAGLTAWLACNCKAASKVCLDSSLIPYIQLLVCKQQIS
jgi:hypothetical protein